MSKSTRKYYGLVDMAKNFIYETLYKNTGKLTENWVMQKLGRKYAIYLCCR
jgi:hypothetical protein